MHFHFDAKICIPIHPLHQGGAFYFIHLLREFLTRTGVPWTEDIYDEFNILFVNSWQVPYEIILHAKQARPAIRVVQRVDGSARDYGRFDDADAKQARVNMLVDLTIFQSHYSRYSATEKFKVIRQDGPIIYNPVDTDLFRPDEAILPFPRHIKVCNASFSTNRKKGTWKIGRLAKANPDVTFVLCGRYLDLPQLSNICFLGHLGREEIATAMRSCDVFLHLAENDPCPNVVLEALASGLPVLYKDSGGTPELVGECGVPVEVENFRQQLEAVLDRREELSQAARARAVERFAPDAIFPQYLEAIERAERRPLPTRWDILRAALRGYPVLPPFPPLACRTLGRVTWRALARLRRSCPGQ